MLRSAMPASLLRHTTERCDACCLGSWWRAGVRAAIVPTTPSPPAPMDIDEVWRGDAACQPMHPGVLVVTNDHMLADGYMATGANVGAVVTAPPVAVDSFAALRDVAITVAAPAFVTCCGQRGFVTGDVAQWVSAPPPGALACHSGDGLDPCMVVQYTGRASDVYNAQVNGARVDVLEVESVARRVPGCRDAVARVLAAHGSASGRLVLWLEAASSPQRSHTAVQRRVHDALSGALRPTSVPALPDIVTQDALPRLGTGKVDVGALVLTVQDSVYAADAVDAAGTSVPAAQPGDAGVVLRVLERVLSLPSHHLDDGGMRQLTLAQLGGDSLRAVALLKELRVATGQELTFDDLATAGTPDALLAMLAQTVAKDGSAQHQGTLSRKVGADMGSDKPDAGRAGDVIVTGGVDGATGDAATATSAYETVEVSSKEWETTKGGTTVAVVRVTQPSWEEPLYHRQSVARSGGD